MLPTRIKNKSNGSTYTPAVTFQQAKISYFIHDHTVYSLAECPTAVFREAVLALMPQWTDSALYASLVANPDDLATRWFLLCGLCEAKRPMTLYGSRDQAEQALHREARSAGISEHAASH